MGLEARRRALLHLRVKGAIELPLLIVHLTQDHVVLQEELVSHTKSGKSKQGRKDMEGSPWMVGAPNRGGGHMGLGVPGSLLLELSRGVPKSPRVSPALCQALRQPTV